VDAQGDFKQNTTNRQRLNGCSFSRKAGVIADLCNRCDIALMAKALLSRIFRVAVFAAAAVAGAASAAPQRVVAVGDLHGDLAAWQQIARSAGLIDAKGHWAGGKTILVQMGDITDRGPDSLKIARSLQQLQKEAPRKGGKAIVVLGNHEAMNLLGDNRYTTAGEYAAFADGQSAARRDKVYAANRAAIEAAAKTATPAATPDQVRANWIAEHPLGWVEHRLAWGPSGELGKWAAANSAIVKVDGTLFAHGGISAEYAKQPLDIVNARVAAAMVAGDDGDASVLTDPLGPLWYRGLVQADADAQAARAAAKPPAPPLTQEQELTAVLAAYGAQRLVIAHTPSLSGILLTNGGRLARIDTGISRYYGGPLTWLEIVDGQMIPHTVPRSP
jgi:hypothetical protein